jgi:hypothetical protein
LNKSRQLPDEAGSSAVDICLRTYSRLFASIRGPAFRMSFLAFSCLLGVCFLLLKRGDALWVVKDDGSSGVFECVALRNSTVFVDLG